MNALRPSLHPGGSLWMIMNCLCRLILWLIESVTWDFFTPPCLSDHHMAGQTICIQRGFLVGASKHFSDTILCKKGRDRQGWIRTQVLVAKFAVTVTVGQFETQTLWEHNSIWPFWHTTMDELPIQYIQWHLQCKKWLWICHGVRLANYHWKRCMLRRLWGWTARSQPRQDESWKVGAPLPIQ